MQKENKKDQILVERLKEGDIDAFKQAFNQYAGLLYAFAGKFTDSNTAKDLVQDVFLKVWLNRNNFSINESVKAYLFRAVRNRCINYLEHLKSRAAYTVQEKIELQIKEALFYDTPEQILIQREQLDMILGEIEKLPEKCRLIFKMTYLEDKKASEIADTLKLSIRTVETQVYKALKTLRNQSFKN